MRIMIPPPQESDFRVGATITGVVKNIAPFGLFIDLAYSARGHQWGIDGLLHFGRTPRPEQARAYHLDHQLQVVVTEWNISKYRLQVALPADPSWLTTTVVGLARGIRADQAFDRMPILGDALEEAGCTDAAVLHHCRSPRLDEGSWLIPLLIGNPHDADQADAGKNRQRE